MSPQSRRVSFCIFQVGTCHCSNALSWQCQQQPSPQEPSSPWSKGASERTAGPFSVAQDDDVRTKEGNTSHGRRKFQKRAASLCPQPSNQEFGKQERELPPNPETNTCEQWAFQGCHRSTLSGTPLPNQGRGAMRDASSSGVPLLKRKTPAAPVP